MSERWGAEMGVMCEPKEDEPDVEWRAEYAR